VVLTDPALAVTLKGPGTALTVNAAAVATPMELVNEYAVPPPLNVPLSPAAPAFTVNITSASCITEPYWLSTETDRGVLELSPAGID
jgi:hypothetical protein